MLSIGVHSNAYAEQHTQVVSTSHGKVIGKIEDGLSVFRGLRYAAPPTGTNRFKPPQPLTPWDDVYEAFDFNHAAMQTPTASALPSETHSEDCLYLHLWTKGVDNKKRPVMVWLHGGGYWEGAPGRPVYYGHNIAQQDVVIVTVTHRLNVFGFTQLPDSWGPAYKSSGMAGMLDIVSALEWVKDNIAAFGGDPNNVTIFGESGGGAKVSMLMNMPAAEGLFHKAIIQSGAVMDANTNVYGQALGQALLDTLGIETGNIEQLSNVEANLIFESQSSALEMVKDLAPKQPFAGNFSPTVDGIELPAFPFSGNPSAFISAIPLMIGTNKHEATFFPFLASLKDDTKADFEKRISELYPEKANEVANAFYASYPDYTPGDLSFQLQTNEIFWNNTIRVADIKSVQQAPVYLYRFDWESQTVRNGVQLKATHAVDVPIIFGTYESLRGFVGPGNGPELMMKQMLPTWVAFAKSGDPNNASIPEWPAYNTSSRQTMLFNLKSEVVSDPASAVRKAIITP